jgi:hypothetical protein
MVHRRLLSFSVPVAVAQLSSSCLAGDVHGAVAALSPAIKGRRQLVFRHAFQAYV